MQRIMIAAAAAATVDATFGADKGYFNGLKDGLFLPIEDHALRVTECKKPGLPRPLRSEYAQKALTFWPMVKMMITS